jgi:hypothetical protein
MKSYLLKKGTILYRGDTPYFLNKGSRGERTILPSDSLHLEKKPTFFALKPDDVYQYGLIYGWEVPDDIELPLLDNHAVMTEIYNGATERVDVQKVMRENYGYRPEGGFVDRESYFERDILFYQYLCEKGYPGYASYDLEDGERTSVEIMICDPTLYKCKGLFYPTDVKDQDLYIRNQIQKYYERVNPNGNQKRKKAKVDGATPEKGSRSFGVKGNLFANLFGDSPEKGTNLFGDSPEKGTNFFGSDSPEKGTNLFGDSSDTIGSDSHVFNTPKKAGSRKRGKSKKNRKPKLTRRR